MHDVPRRIKRLLREYAGRAHEEELRRELQPIAAGFDEWRRGSVDTWELCDRIHEFHNGAARRLFNLYTDRDPTTAVAHAIHTGVIPRDQVPEELLEHLENALALYRHLERQE
jgi:hypothetical protein